MKHNLYGIYYLWNILFININNNLPSNLSHFHKIRAIKKRPKAAFLFFISYIIYLVHNRFKSSIFEIFEKFNVFFSKFFQFRIFRYSSS